MRTDDPTLPVAIVSFLPVVLSAMGLHFVARSSGRADPRLGDLARTGMIVITVGGLAGAVWSVVVATTANDIGVLQRTSLGLIAPGSVFVALAFLAATGVERARRSARVVSRTAVALLVLAIGWGIGQSEVRALEIVLLVITLVGWALLLTRAVAVARSRGLPRAAALFTFTLPATIVLAALISFPQTIALRWSEQLIAVASMAAFARAAWILTVRAVPAEPAVA